MSWINYNGQIFLATDPVFYANNRAFRYGDGIFESIRVLNSKIPFLKDHIGRLELSMEQLHLEPANYYTEHFFRQKILELMETNSLVGNARVRLSVFRGKGGFYTPLDNTAEYLLEVFSMESGEYSLNETGYRLDVYPNYQKAYTGLSGLKSINAQIYVLASIYARQNNLDDCLIINTEDRIAESTHSNIMIYKNGKLYSPAYTEGCVSGVMKEVITVLANRMNIDFIPSRLEITDIESADEIILTNAIKGVQWVGNFRDHKYKNELSSVLTGKLNEYVINGTP